MIKNHGFIFTVLFIKSTFTHLMKVLFCPVLSLKVRKTVTDCSPTETDISNAEEIVHAFKPTMVPAHTMCEMIPTICNLSLLCFMPNF